MAGLAGFHLWIDGVRSNDHVAIDTFLLEMAAAIGMTPIATPLVRRAHGTTIGVLLIAESHIMIHNKDNGETFVDVFSCKAFPPMHALDLVVSRFGGRRRWRVQMIRRGLESGAGGL